MQITLFKGLLPVNLPDPWFGKNDSSIKFANINGAQAIDFRAVGGKALKFWVQHSGSLVSQHWAEVQNPDEVEWGNKPHAIDARSTVQMFGQSSKILNLTHL